MEDVSTPTQGFAATGLSPVILDALEKCQFTTPTPIQAEAIPVALKGGDVIGLAQTGTGKTMAFGLPMIERMLANRNQKGLVIVPTRELALQVEENLHRITRKLNPGVRTICLIGGMPIYRQIRDLKSNPTIIIGTPGRLRDHMDQKTLDLSKVSMLVLDEADRMLDMGFTPQINYICQALSTDRQTMLFSATLAPEIASLTHKYLVDPVRIEVAKAGSSNRLVTQELCYLTPDGKIEELELLLQSHTGTVLVFSRTKHGAGKLMKRIQSMGHTAAEIHSNRSLSQRRQALDGFKSGKYRVLVATDVASRGIDVQNIALVINFDLPDASEDYVHRIGRTGRAGSTGLAISFATTDQLKDVRSIEKLLGNKLQLSERSLPEPQQRAWDNGGRMAFRSPRGRFNRSSGARRR